MATRRINGPVNMTDVAQRAGVSQSTVSRVINNHPGISRRTRLNVLDSLRVLGYKSEVRDLIEPDRSEPLAVVLAMCPLPEQRDPFALEYFRLLADGVREGFDGENVNCRLVTLAAESTELPEADSAPDGVILVGFPTEGLRAKLREENITYVITSGDIYAADEDMVTVNNFEAGVEGCRYFLERGVTRIGFLLTPYNLARFAGFQAELTRCGLSVRPEDCRILPDTNLSSFIDAIHRWIAEKDLPEALVVSFVDAAETARTILHLHGVRVPEDIRLLTFDHHCGRKSDIVGLHSDPYRLGFRSAKRLIEKVRTGDDGPIQIVVSMTLSANDLIPECPLKNKPQGGSEK